MSAQPKIYPISIWDVEAYYFGQRESSALDMLYPTCSGCGSAVTVLGMSCDKCKVDAPDTHKSETPLSVVFRFAAGCACVAFLMFVLVAVIR